MSFHDNFLNRKKKILNPFSSFHLFFNENIPENLSPRDTEFEARYFKQLYFYNKRKKCTKKKIQGCWIDHKHQRMPWNSPREMERCWLGKRKKVSDTSVNCSETIVQMREAKDSQKTMRGNMLVVKLFLKFLRFSTNTYNKIQRTNVHLKLISKSNGWNIYVFFLIRYTL